MYQYGGRRNTWLSYEFERRKFRAVWAVKNTFQERSSRTALSPATLKASSTARWNESASISMRPRQNSFTHVREMCRTPNRLDRDSLMFILDIPLQQSRNNENAFSRNYILFPVRTNRIVNNSIVVNVLQRTISLCYLPTAKNARVFAFSDYYN